MKNRVKKMLKVEILDQNTADPQKVGGKPLLFFVGT